MTTVNPCQRNGHNAGARKGLKKMSDHARARSWVTRKAKAAVKKIEGALHA